MSVNCPACGTPNAASVNFCQHCGAGLQAQTSATAAGQSPIYAAQPASSGYNVGAVPVKEPSTGLLLELLGLFGFLGIGWMWAGETAVGVILLIGYWFFCLIEVLLFSIVIGFCLIPCNFAIPIGSAIILQRRLKARQAAAQWPQAL